MPNEALISQLDSLRESYTQREKTAAGLQAAFKLTTNAHSKTQKALNDYGAQDATVDVHATQAAFAALRLKEDAIDPLLPDLRREIKALAGVTSALKEAAAALRSVPVDVVRLDKAATHLQVFKEQPVVDLLPELQQELDLAQRALGDEFGQKLRGALADLGITIGGRAPKFELGRFELEANFAKRAANETRVNIVDVYVEMVILRQGRAFASEPSMRTFTRAWQRNFAVSKVDLSPKKSPYDDQGRVYAAVGNGLGLARTGWHQRRRARTDAFFGRHTAPADVLDELHGGLTL